MYAGVIMIVHPHLQMQASLSSSTEQQQLSPAQEEALEEMYQVCLLSLLEAGTLPARGLWNFRIFLYVLAGSCKGHWKMAKGG